jgi:hypothetical protein
MARTKITEKRKKKPTSYPAASQATVTEEHPTFLWSSF